MKQITSFQKAIPSIGVALGFLLLCLFIQRSAGASDAAFLAYPDEPSHFIGSVMVRDYLASGLSSNPYGFAQSYYSRYPFFAVGYWPPMFYMLTGFWLLIFGVGKFQALFLSAGAAAGMAWLLFSLVRKQAGFIAGCCAGLLFVTLVDVQFWMSAVMVDLMVGFFVLAAAVRLLSYMDRPTYSNAILCALCCGCATLTKYSGAYACVLPLAACILLGRFSLLRKPSFFVLYAVMISMVGPWALWTSRLSKVGLPQEQRGTIVSRVGPFLKESFRLFPPALAVIVIIGIVALLLTPRIWRSDIVVIALLYAGCVGLLIVSPVVGPERRYLFVASASLLAMAFAGWAVALQRINWLRAEAWATPALAIVLTVSIVPAQLIGRPRLPENLIRRAVKTIVENPAWAGKRILVAPDLEGPVIAEFAIQDRHRPGYTLLRPGKLFADRDWMGGHYQSHFQSEEEMVAYLRKNPVDLIVWHRQTQEPLLAHQRYMEEMLAARDSAWHRVATFNSVDASQPSWEIYQSQP
jgi:hypothetical protein